MKLILTLIFVLLSASLLGKPNSKVDYLLNIDNASALSSLELSSKLQILLNGLGGGVIQSINCNGSIKSIEESTEKDSINIWGSMSCRKFDFNSGFSVMPKEETMNYMKSTLAPNIGYSFRFDVRPRPSVGGSN